MQHRTIALYNRKGERLLTLREAEAKGHGSVITLKQRIRRNQVKGYKAGTLWLVRQKDLTNHRRSHLSA